MLVNENEGLLDVEAGPLALLVRVGRIKHLARPLSAALLLAHEMHELVSIVFYVQLELLRQILLVDEVRVEFEKGVEEGQQLPLATLLSLFTRVILHLRFTISSLFERRDRLLDERSLLVGHLDSIKKELNGAHSVYFEQGSEVLQYLALHLFLGLHRFRARHALEQLESVRAKHLEGSLIELHLRVVRVLLRILLFVGSRETVKVASLGNGICAYLFFNLVLDVFLDDREHGGLVAESFEAPLEAKNCFLVDEVLEDALVRFFLQFEAECAVP